MSKNITTKTTIQNLAAELKKTFAKKTELTPIQNAAAAAFKSLKVENNTVSFYTSTDKTGAAAATLDFPAEYFLDQAKTTLVPKFTWDEATYPGSTNPNLNNKPVLVLAVKGDDGSVSYSFLNMEKLMNVYTVKTDGKDKSTTVTIDGYTIDVKVNISQEAGNQIQMKDDGLYVPKPAEIDISGKADKVAGATAGHIAALDADGNPTDSGVEAAKVITEADIVDYTPEEIADLLKDDPAQA